MGETTIGGKMHLRVQVLQRLPRHGGEGLRQAADRVLVPLFGPVGAEEDDGAGRDAAVHRLPSLHVRDGSRVSRVFGHPGGGVNHHQRPKRNGGWDFVGAHAHLVKVAASRHKRRM